MARQQLAHVQRFWCACRSLGECQQHSRRCHHHGSGFHRSSHAVHLDGFDNTGQSGSVTFSVYDCDSEILGCTDPGALNYNAAATIDDGSCTYPCTDVTVTILTDNYPAETTWAVTDESGATVMSGAPIPRQAPRLRRQLASKWGVTTSSSTTALATAFAVPTATAATRSRLTALRW